MKFTIGNFFLLSAAEQYADIRAVTFVNLLVPACRSDFKVHSQIVFTQLGYLHINLCGFEILRLVALIRPCKIRNIDKMDRHSCNFYQNHYSRRI